MISLADEMLPVFVTFSSTKSPVLMYPQTPPAVVETPVESTLPLLTLFLHTILAHEPKNPPVWDAESWSVDLKIVTVPVFTQSTTVSGFPEQPTKPPTAQKPVVVHVTAALLVQLRISTSPPPRLPPTNPPIKMNDSSRLVEPVTVPALVQCSNFKSVF